MVPKKGSYALLLSSKKLTVAVSIDKYHIESRLTTFKNRISNSPKSIQAFAAPILLAYPIKTTDNSTKPNNISLN